MNRFPWECYTFLSESTIVGFKNAQVDSVDRRQVSASATRVKKDNRIGFFVQSGDTGNTLDETLPKALELAENGAEYCAEFAVPAHCSSVSVYDSSIKNMSVEHLMQIAEKSFEPIKTACSDALIDAAVCKTVEDVSIRNSNGLEINYLRSVFNFFVGIEIIEGTSFFYLGDSLSRTSFLESDLERVIQRITHKLSLARTETVLPTGKYPVIFTPRAALSILFIIQNALNGHTFYRGTSPLRGKIGQSICDEKISISDDPTRIESPFSALCDDEGVPSQNKVLIRKGVLESILTDLESAARLNMHPSGNAIRSKGFFYTAKDYASLPAPAPTNWRVASGNTGYADLIAGIKNGVLIDQVLGLHTGNLLNGDFSVNISSGYHIKNGKISGRIKDALIAANVYTMLAERLVECSSETEEIDVSGIHSVPYLMFKDMSIACG